MSCCRALILTAVGCFWMLAIGGPRSVEGQVRALPPSGPIGYPISTMSADQRLSYDPADNGALGEVFPGQGVAMDAVPGRPAFGGDCWSWQLLPDGLLYPAYLAGGRESRIASQWIHEEDRGWLWDVALGGHVGMLRYGSQDPWRPEGCQLDIEGAAFPRLTMGSVRDLTSVDFRFGVPLTFRRGPVETKFAYYHLSSHLGDEFMVAHATFDRINYSRDVLVAGLALRPHQALRLYAEAGWAFYIDGGSRPWEFQFGVEFSPVRRWCLLGTPFFAAGARLREEVDFGGNLTAQTGLQWRGPAGQLLRAGAHYFNGKSDQYQFFTEHEEQIGAGVWYDF